MARDNAIMGWDGQREQPIKISPTTRALVVVDNASHEVMHGDAYSCTYSVASIGDLDNDVMQFTWTTPDSDDYMRMVMNAKCGATALFRFHEGWTGGGTATGTTPSDNRNRNSHNTSSVIISYGHEIVTGGTLVKQEYLAAGKFGAGEYSSVNKWVLRRNTKYAMSLFLSGANAATIALHWYEHEAYKKSIG